MENPEAPHGALACPSSARLDAAARALAGPLMLAAVQASEHLMASLSDADLDGLIALWRAWEAQPALSLSAILASLSDDDRAKVEQLRGAPPIEEEPAFVVDAGGARIVVMYDKPTLPADPEPAAEPEPELIPATVEPIVSIATPAPTSAGIW
jgi:hypothetical protein